MPTTYNKGQEKKEEEYVVPKQVNDYILGLGFKKAPETNVYELNVGFKVFKILVCEVHVFIWAEDEITDKRRPILHLYKYENVAGLDYVIQRLSSLKPFITGGYFS